MNAKERELKLKEYINELINDYLHFIQGEKEKEKQRISIYNSANEEDKKELEIQLTEEREKSIALIMKKKEENAEKLKAYKKSLLVSTRATTTS